MSVEAHEQQFESGPRSAAQAQPPAQVSARRVLRRVSRASSRRSRSRFSSSLTRRIVVLNLGGLVALLLGFLYLNQFREGLIDARVQSLQTQGEIIAAAVAASATVDDGFDHDRSGKAAADWRPAKATASPTKAGRRSNFRSIPNASGRCCAASCRRHARARASMIATAICCSIPAR